MTVFIIISENNAITKRLTAAPDYREKLSATALDSRVSQILVERL